ncbi:hypothetical protein BDN67DRAFT_984167 [Paxillus ammoniavirescens]|nr:hypothetical protein BDN67DRAFT_984167 [Paxillus ammoniavirescens]
MAAQRNKNILGKLLLIMDKMSLLTTDTLSHLSQVTLIVNGVADSSVAFRGLSVLLSGDFHQFPPVKKQNRALFLQSQPTAYSEIGCNLYLQFNTVITLSKQMHVTDPVWNGILGHAREGECTKEDLAIICSLVLTDEHCIVPDFTSPLWSDTLLITAQNSVRSEWNKLSTIKHCKSHGSPHYLALSEDSSLDGQLTMQEKLTIAKMPINDTAHLPMQCEIVLGMEVMATENISTAANLANGSRGVVTKIFLNPREPREQNIIDRVIHLRYPPVYIALKLKTSDLPVLPLLNHQEVPLCPVIHNFYVGWKPCTRITHHQLPLMTAYAFTDFKSQGQTIEKLIIDIGKTTSFNLTPFNAYVALSRSHGRDSIHLLQDFKNNLFTKHPSEDLREKDC